jgi:FkbM family methyltransferase
MQIIKSSFYYIRSIFSLISGFENPFQIIQFFLFLGSNSAKNTQVCLKEKPVTFHIRNAMDIWSIKETFLDDFYHFAKFQKPVIGTIIDIGAGIGEFAIQAAIACPSCRVIGFEPFTESFDYFQRNTAKNSLTNVTAVQAAVSSVPGSMVMDTSSGNPLQFRAQSGISSELSVKTVLLMQYLNDESIDSVDILKLDCEGGEFDILLPLSVNDLSRFYRIVMEYHDALTMHNHIELVQLLENANFKVEVVPNLIHHEIGYIYAQLAH